MHIFDNLFHLLITNIILKGTINFVINIKAPPIHLQDLFETCDTALVIMRRISKKLGLYISFIVAFYDWDIVCNFADKVTLCKLVASKSQVVCKFEYMFFYKHSVFQSEARTSLSFSQIQPQNMLKVCLSKNIQKMSINILFSSHSSKMGTA